MGFSTMTIDLNMLKNMSVLYAEDDEVSRESTTRILSVLFKKVISVSDGAQAMELYEKERPDVIILDIRMPSLNGLEVTSLIRKTNISTPIIIATSYKEEQDLLTAIKLNLTEYLIKPFAFEELRVALLSALKRLDRFELLETKITETLSYSYATKTLFSEGKPVKLTKNETLIFELLLKKRGSLVSYDTVESHLGFDYFKTKDSLKNTISRLRKKINANSLIANVQDLGYILA